MNVFTKKRLRGRPRGLSRRGQDVRKRLYDTSIALMAERGYEAATLRDVAAQAGVSAGLLYRYFPSKRAVVMQLYDELSADLVDRAQAMPEGRWAKRFMFALTTSLAVLAPHRAVLSALVPVLVGDPAQGLFAPSTAFSLFRVQGVFVDAVLQATDRPRPQVGEALGRLLYVVHLAVILWWLLDRSRDQVATTKLVALIGRTLPAIAAGIRVPLVRRSVTAGEALVREGLFGEV
jgi:AcrR family transcriptional regulator